MFTMMKSLKNKIINNRFYTLCTIAVILFWLKTYVVYLVEFNLGVKGIFQNFLLFINPISSALFIGFAFFFKGKGQYRAIILIDFLLTFLLYANIIYYRFFNDFLTVATVLSAKSNSEHLGFGPLMEFWDIFYFADIILLIFMIIKKKVPLIHPNRKILKKVMIAIVCIFMVNLGLAEISRPQLLSRTFDRNYLVKYLGVYNFTLYDIVQSTRTITQRATADSSDVVAVENYVKANYASPNPNYFGVAQGKNVILISLESLQSFVINYKLNGQEVTPFLNSLANGNDTFYFKNHFHQTSQGKTSDAEFMMDTSLFPLAQGSVYVNKAQNTYQATPAILKGIGYHSAVFHGNNKTFWNRNEMYRSLGYDQFFDSEYYSMADDKIKNYGMKDVPFFQETMPILTKLEQPFYAKFITLSNHFPFGMDPEDTDFPVGDFGDDVVNQYFQSANYLDQSIKLFFDELKASGLYDNSVIVMYGDHYGISENHSEAMAKVLGKEELTEFDQAQLQRVPLFIHIPGVQGGVIDKFSGHVDVRPTLLHLLGIDTKDYLEFGTDILSDQHPDLVTLRNGALMTSQYTYTDEEWYNNQTGLPIPKEDLEKDSDGKDFGTDLTQIVKDKLDMSDAIVNKDLLRFYTPSGFTPVNREDYQYLKPTEEELAKYK